MILNQQHSLQTKQETQMNFVALNLRKTSFLNLKTVSILLHLCHSEMYTTELQFLRIDSFTFIMLHSLNFCLATLFQDYGNILSDCQNFATLYLNFQVSVTCFIFQGGCMFISTRSRVQLARQHSCYQRPHIDGHTVRVQIAVHSTAPFIRHLFAANVVTYQDFVMYWLLKGDDAIVQCCEKPQYIFYQP